MNVLGLSKEWNTIKFQQETLSAYKSQWLLFSCQVVLNRSGRCCTWHGLQLWSARERGPVASGNEPADSRNNWTLIVSAMDRGRVTLAVEAYGILQGVLQSSIFTHTHTSKHKSICSKDALFLVDKRKESRMCWIVQFLGMENALNRV